MTSPRVAPWSLSVLRPTCVLSACCLPEQALGALADALRAHRGFRLRPSTALSVEAVAGYPILPWLSPLQGWWPWGTYGTLLATAELGPPGTDVRIRYPKLADDLGAARHVAATLDDMVRRLEAAGVRVDVGPWESGLVAR